MKKYLIFFALFLLWSASLHSQDIDISGLIAKSESLANQGDFYGALIALETLLVSDQKSDFQEKALWQTNAFCETLISDSILLEEFERSFFSSVTDDKMPSDEDYTNWEKITNLNRLGADIGFDHLAHLYSYGYGFLKRLVDLYPESKFRPSAEYYLIDEGYNSFEAVEKWLSDLYSYINKYEGSTIKELDIACLDIALICHNLWQLLTYPDEYTELFSSGDTAADSDRATKYKSAALKYYSKVIISGYRGRFKDTIQREDIIELFNDIKRGEKSSRLLFIIIYD